MMRIIIAMFLAILLPTLGQTQADPVSRGVNGYSSPSPVSNSINFQLENGDAADRAIPANTVEWEIVFPNEIMYVGAGVFTGTPFYEFSRGVNPDNDAEFVVIIRNDSEVPRPLPTDPDVAVFNIQYNVQGKKVDQLGTMTLTAMVLPGNETTVGNLDEANDFASSPIEFSEALPINLLEFIAFKDNQSSELRWSTATELNNEKFEIERSENGRDFEKIGEVKGQGTTSKVSKYSYSDKNIGRSVQGKVYYRLVQVDYDGSKDYTEIRNVAFSDAEREGISVHPNPTSGVLSLNVGAGMEDGKVEIYDQVGKRVSVLPVIGNGTIDLSSQVGGVYILKFIDVQEELIATKRVIKI